MYWQKADKSLVGDEKNMEIDSQKVKDNKGMFILKRSILGNLLILTYRWKYIIVDEYIKRNFRV